MKDLTSPPWHPGFSIVLILFLLIAGYFLWTENRAHLLGALPWVLLLACPILHLLLHGGHAGHGRHRDGDQP